MVQEIERPSMVYNDVDVRLEAVYLAATLSKQRQKEEGISHLMPRRKALSIRVRQLIERAEELAGPMPRKVAQQALDEDGHDAIGYEDGSEIINRKLDEPEVSEFEVSSPWLPLRRGYTA